MFDKEEIIDWVEDFYLKSNIPFRDKEEIHNHFAFILDQIQKNMIHDWIPSGFIHYVLEEEWEMAFYKADNINKFGLNGITTISRTDYVVDDGMNIFKAWLKKAKQSPEMREKQLKNILDNEQETTY